MNYIREMNNKEIERYVEYYFGWNNLSKRDKEVFEAIINNKNIKLTKDELLELEMFGILEIKKFN